MCVCSLLKEKHFLVNFVALTHHHPPIYQLPFSLCHGDYEDDHFCFLLSAGELEKQQGAKTHSVKNNGTQLELRGKQGSPSGVCVCVCAYCCLLNPTGETPTALLICLPAAVFMNLIISSKTRHYLQHLTSRTLCNLRCVQCL